MVAAGRRRLVQRWTRIAHGVTHRLGSAVAFAALGVLFVAWLAWGVISAPGGRRFPSTVPSDATTA